MIFFFFLRHFDLFLKCSELSAKHSETVLLVYVCFLLLLKLIPNLPFNIYGTQMKDTVVKNK